MRYHLNSLCPECTCFVKKLEPEALSQIECHTFEPGEWLCEKGKTIHKVLMLCQGTAKAVCVEKKSDRYHDLIQHHPGDLFGDYEVLGSTLTWYRSVVAQSPCTVLSLDPEIFLASLKNLNIASLVLKHTLRRQQQVQRAFIDYGIREECQTDNPLLR